MKKKRLKKKRSALPKVLGLLLSTAVVLSLLPFSSGATAADDQEKELLGTLSKSYEASSPGSISSGVGDAGGKSYGSYQFSSASGIPKLFFEWCQDSSDAYYQSIGDRLSDAYYNGGAGYGASFDTEWKALASENADGFEQAQRNYVRLRYYDPIIKKMESTFDGFYIDNYSIALRNVLWSRAVQLGVNGALSCAQDAMSSLGGFANQHESEIIRAIYEDCSEVRDPRSGESVMSGTNAEKYGVSGKVLAWFRGSSGDVQLGVYVRLAINEPAKAQQMLATYGYVDAPVGEGAYQLVHAAGSGLAATAADDNLTLSQLNGRSEQNFRLTYFASGYYILASESDGQRITASADGSVSRTAPGTDNAQMWQLTALGSGYTLKNRATGQYLSVKNGTLSTAAEPAQWQLSKAGSSWTLDGAVYPTYAATLKEGSSSFPLRGTLRCAYPIQSLTLRVLDAAGKDAFSPIQVSDIAAYRYDLSKLDSKVSFGKLEAGSYTLVIEAVSDSPGNDPFLLESGFYVSDGQYVLAFDACGGTVTETVRTLSAGQVYGELPTARKTGYLFLGWFTAPEGGTQVASSTVAAASNTVVYAQYEKACCYTFLNYDGSVFAYGELPSGSTVPLPSTQPSRLADGAYYYSFAGWNGYSEDMTITGDVTFEARYEAHQYELLPGISTGTYRITENFLRAIATGTTVAELQANLAPAQSVSILRDGTLVEGGLVGTGMTVSCSDGDNVIQTLDIVVTGDLSGDGVCDITDMVQLRAHLLGRRTLSPAALQASDLNGDGTVDITDMVQLRAHLLGRRGLSPN